jgi:hypothetical protein
MRQVKLIEFVTAELSKTAQLRALFLGGSFGSNRQDEYSDVDFLAIASPGAEAELAETWRSLLSQLNPVVFWNVRPAGGLLANGITADWTRCDLYIISEEDIKKRSRDAIRPLIDPGEIYRRLPEKALVSNPNPDTVARTVKEFIRVLGLLVVVIGREEYITGVGGIFHLRNHLITLLLEGNTSPHKGGALHLNRLLTEDQKKMLEAIPSIESSRQSIIRAHLEYARLFFPLARRLVAETQQEWPSEFEEATWSLLKTELDIDPVYEA